MKRLTDRMKHDLGISSAGMFFFLIVFCLAGLIDDEIMALGENTISPVISDARFTHIRQHDGLTCFDVVVEQKRAPAILFIQFFWTQGTSADRYLIMPDYVSFYEYSGPFHTQIGWSTGLNRMPACFELPTWLDLEKINVTLFVTYRGFLGRWRNSYRIGPVPVRDISK